MKKQSIQINNRTYYKNAEVDRFQIPFDELDNLRLVEIPAHSHVEIMDLPKSYVGFKFELFAVNGGEDGDEEYLSIYGSASMITLNDTHPILDRLRRVFAPMMMSSTSLVPNPSIVKRETDAGTEMAAAFSFNFENKGETLIRDAIEPLLSYFHKLIHPEVRLFICHASEDKSVAEGLALFFHRRGADVWLDKWEIKVGDSIVQKINDALSSVSHLAILLSNNSVNKHWVAKEFSSALMRQLENNSITVLPVRLDDCPVPSILADIKYADCRTSLTQGFLDLEQALFPSLLHPGNA